VGGISNRNKQFLTTFLKLKSRGTVA